VPTPIGREAVIRDSFGPALAPPIPSITGSTRCRFWALNIVRKLSPSTGARVFGRRFVREFATTVVGRHFTGSRENRPMASQGAASTGRIAQERAGPTNWIAGPSPPLGTGCGMDFRREREAPADLSTTRDREGGGNQLLENFFFFLFCFRSSKWHKVGGTSGLDVYAVPARKTQTACLRTVSCRSRSERPL